MKNAVMFCFISALILSLVQSVHAQSTSSSMAMPACGASDPVVAMNMKTKMYRTQAQIQQKYPNESPEKMTAMMKAHNAQWMCKSKADAMGGKMMTGSSMSGSMMKAQPTPVST